MLLEFLQWDFAGDLQAKLEAFERGVTQYNAAAGRELEDDIKIVIVLK